MMGQQQTMRVTGSALRRILLVLAVTAILVLALSAPAFARSGDGGGYPIGPPGEGAGGCGIGGNPDIRYNVNCGGGVYQHV